jgi:hypothetical protein
MTMDDKSIKRGFRQAWILVALAFVHVVAFWAFNFWLNQDTPNADWDLDDKPIVPANSIEADGYYHEVDTRYGK